jgi:hypothetical protein
MLSDDLELDDYNDFLGNDADSGVSVGMGRRSSAGSFSGSDSFDPSDLLSEPLFDDGDVLNDIIQGGPHGTGVPEPVATESGSESSRSRQNLRGGMYGQDANYTLQQLQQQQQVAFQLQLQQQQQMVAMGMNEERPFEPATFNPSQEHFGGNFHQDDMNPQPGMGMNIVHNQQNEVNKRMLEVQQKIQQVEQQIQNVQLRSPHTPSAHLENQNPQLLQQQGFQGHPGASPGSMSQFTRSPPGRSISMPAQRIRRSPASPFTNTFVMQQQQQQQSALQAMSQSMNSAYSEPAYQQQIQLMNDSSTRSVPAQMGADSGMSQLALMQQATMQGVGQLPLTPQMQSGVNSPYMRNKSLPRSRNNSLPPVGMPLQSIEMGMPGDLGENMVGNLTSGNFDATAMSQSFAAANQQTGGDQQASNVNEAMMEKLCESMRRSAMSRSLVKQYSGTSVPRSHGGLGVQRTNSGRLTKNVSGKNLVRSNSGRQLSRANSGKSLQRNHSGRQVLMGGVDTAELQPVRRMSQESKHRLTPTRGVFRNHSTTAIIGAQKMENVVGMQQQQQHDLLQMQQMQQMQQLQQLQQQMQSFTQNGMSMMDQPNLQQQQHQQQQQMIDPSSIQQMEDGQLPNFYPHL